MPEMIENRIVVDSEWIEIEYGTYSKSRLERERRTFDEMEMEEEEWK